MARRQSGIFQVSHSEMQTYKDCKRRWMLQYYMRLSKKRSAPRLAADTGIAVHDALHQYYTLGGRKNHDEAYKAALEHIDSAHDSALARDLSKEEIDTVDDIYETATILAKGYFKWVDETGADDHWIVKGSEERLVVPGPLPDTEIKGFVDIHGVHEPSGDLLVADTKVVASIGDNLKTLHLNEQAPLYAILMKMIYPEFEGFRVVWNFIKRNKQTARAKGPFYQRYELAINPEQLTHFYGQLQGQIADMLETERRLQAGEHHVMVAYPNPTQDCSWKCPYLPLCGAMNDPRSDSQWIMDNLYEVWDEGQTRESVVESTVTIKQHEVKKGE